MRKDPFDKVYEENYEKVYNAVYMRLLNRENTEDIVSDTFLKALNAYDRFDPKVSSVYTWLCRIATNTMYDQFRKNEVRKVISLDEYLDEGIEPGAYDEELLKLTDDNAKRAFEILSHLNPMERNMISMRFGMDMSYKEMAKALSSNDKAVAKKMERLLAKCKKIAEEKNI